MIGASIAQSTSSDQQAATATGGGGSKRPSRSPRTESDLRPSSERSVVPTSRFPRGLVPSTAPIDACRPFFAPRIDSWDPRSGASTTCLTVKRGRPRSETHRRRPEEMRRFVTRGVRRMTARPRIRVSVPTFRRPSRARRHRNERRDRRPRDPSFLRRLAPSRVRCPSGSEHKSGPGRRRREPRRRCPWTNERHRDRHAITPSPR